MESTPQPVVRMDKSKDYSTVHGERLPNDRHAKVFYYQDGLPFSADEKLIVDHPDITEDTTGRLKERVAHLQKQAIKRQTTAPGDGATDDNDDDRDEAPAEVNLSAWAQGEKFPWQSVSNAIARRFARRVNNKRDAIELLIEEHVVSVDKLSADFKKLLQD
jgi:hypothetical protein